jgi:spore coat protein U-like protein
MTPVARSAFVAAALLASAAGPVIAGSATSTLGVRVVVQPSCSVSGATLDFGNYTSGQAGDLGGFTQIAYSHCAPGQLRFQLDGGSSGSTTARKLGNGSGGQQLRHLP